MDMIKTYGNYLKKLAPDHKVAALRMVKFGLVYESIRSRYFSDKRIPEAYKYLNSYAVKNVLTALKQPGKTVWANLFSPVEILQCFGVNSLSIEALSSFLSGFTIEDYFLDYAEAEGIAPTLCSYHKNFIGAIDSGIIPPAAFSVTTSTFCDGNLSTFRHMEKHHGVPMFLIDVPHDDSDDAVAYVVDQLREFIAQVEDRFNKKLDMDELRQVIERENQSKAYYEEFLKFIPYKHYPSTLTLQMYMLFATHLNIGTPETLRFFRMMSEEIKNAPDFHGTNIFWVHLIPYYQETLKEVFNLTEDYQIQASEMNLDYRPVLDVNDPITALAKKMTGNIYNGSFDRKADLVAEIAKDLESDGVINFCHWGCKQSSGGAMLLKDRLKEEGIPALIIDGDGMDRRNSHDGQIKTRFEAFRELLAQAKE